MCSVGARPLPLILRMLTLLWTDNVIGPQGLLATKARILVTNSIHFLKQFDQVAFIRRGIIIECGPYNELVNNTQTEMHKLM